MNLNITVNEQEQGLLVEVLEQQVESLRREIFHTDLRAYREKLGANKSQLEALVRRVRAAKQS